MADGRPRARSTEPSDAILTVPNVITFCRLALLPVFVWLALGPKRDLAAWVVGFVLGATDYLDGIVARRLGQVSRLGIAMDPLFDRLAIAAAGAVVIVRNLVPWPAVAAVLARDALLLAAVPFLAARGVPRPAVTRTGKLGTFAIMWSFGIFFAVTAPDPPATWLRPIAWSFYGAGIALGYWAAAGYARTVVRQMRAPARP